MLAPRVSGKITAASSSQKFSRLLPAVRTAEERMLHMGMALAALLLAASGGQGSEPADIPSPVVTETRLAILANNRLPVDGTAEKLFFAVSEERQGQDLNGDGDLDDAVAFVFDTRTRSISPVGGGYALHDGRIGSVLHALPRADGELIALAVSEEFHGEADLNGDGDIFDYVVHVLHQGEVRNLGMAAGPSSIVVQGSLVVFETNEYDQGEVDINEDGDVDDTFWCVWNAATPASAPAILPFVNAGLIAVRGSLITFFLPEEDNGDLNGDGDALDFCLVVYDASNGAGVVHGLALRSSERGQIHGLGGRQRRFLVFTVSEALHGAMDLNDDGDASDFIVFFLDTETGTLIEPRDDEGKRIAVLQFEGGVEAGNLIGFYASEADHGVRDLNGDGDASDHVFQVFDRASGRVHNTRLSAGSVLFAGLAAGRDRDGIIQTYDPATEEFLSLGLTSFQGGLEASGNLLAIRPPSGNASHVFDARTRTLHAIPTASAGLSAHRVYYGHAEDKRLRVFDPATGETIDLGLQTGSLVQLHGHLAAMRASDDSVHVFDAVKGLPLWNLERQVMDSGHFFTEPMRFVHGVLTLVRFEESFGDLNGDGDAELSEAVLELVTFDFDGDGRFDSLDNCPRAANPSQSDIDGDGLGDVCDPCPAASGSACNEEGSAAVELSAEEGGVLATPDGALALEVQPGALPANTTLSVTQLEPEAPEADLRLGSGEEGAGQVLAAYNFEPSGLQFSEPVTLTMTADVTALTPEQRTSLAIYLLTDTDADGVPDTFLPVAGSSCPVSEDPPGRFTVICTVQVLHFSTFALLAPLDSDGDGVFDAFGGEQDPCPTAPPLATSVAYGGSMLVATDAGGTAAVVLSAALAAGGAPVEGGLVAYTLTTSEGAVLIECHALTDSSGAASCGIEGVPPDVYTVDVAYAGLAGCFFGSADRALLVVFDPSTPHATGGGFILPDAESTLPASGPQEKANFGFVVRLDKNKAAAGNLEFQYRAAGIELKSTAMSWYTVSNNRAMFQGAARINGAGHYTFRVAATDGDLAGAQPDRFDITIWAGDDTEAAPFHRAKNDLAGGNIVIHRR